MSSESDPGKLAEPENEVVETTSGNLQVLVQPLQVDAQQIESLQDVKRAEMLEHPSLKPPHTLESVQEMTQFERLRYLVDKIEQSQSLIEENSSSFEDYEAFRVLVEEVTNFLKLNPPDTDISGNKKGRVIDLEYRIRSALFKAGLYEALIEHDPRSTESCDEFEQKKQDFIEKHATIENIPHLIRIWDCKLLNFTTLVNCELLNNRAMSSAQAEEIFLDVARFVLALAYAEVFGQLARLDADLMPRRQYSFYKVMEKVRDRLLEVRQPKEKAQALCPRRYQIINGEIILENTPEDNPWFSVLDPNFSHVELSQATTEIIRSYTQFCHREVDAEQWEADSFNAKNAIILFRACLDYAKDLVMMIGPDRYDQVRQAMSVSLFRLSAADILDHEADELLEILSQRREVLGEVHKNHFFPEKSNPNKWLVRLIILAEQPDLVTFIEDKKYQSRQALSTILEHFESSQVTRNKVTFHQYLEYWFNRHRISQEQIEQIKQMLTDVSNRIHTLDETSTHWPQPRSEDVRGGAFRIRAVIQHIFNEKKQDPDFKAWEKKALLLRMSSIASLAQIAYARASQHEVLKQTVPAGLHAYHSEVSDTRKGAFICRSALKIIVDMHQEMREQNDTRLISYDEVEHYTPYYALLYYLRGFMEAVFPEFSSHAELQGAPEPAPQPMQAEEESIEIIDEKIIIASESKYYQTCLQDIIDILEEDDKIDQTSFTQQIRQANNFIQLLDKQDEYTAKQKFLINEFIDTLIETIKENRSTAYREAAALIIEVKRSIDRTAVIEEFKQEDELSVIDAAHDEPAQEAFEISDPLYSRVQAYLEKIESLDERGDIDLNSTDSKYIYEAGIKLSKRLKIYMRKQTFSESISRFIESILSSLDEIFDRNNIEL